MRIELPLFDLSIDRITQAIAHYIILNDQHVIYHVECHIEKQPDKDEGEYKTRDSFCHYHGCFLKSAITAVDLDFNDDTENYENWVVEISVKAMEARIRIKLETQSEGQKLFDTIQEYLLS